jgi:hypothetical protein
MDFIVDPTLGWYQREEASKLRCAATVFIYRVYSSDFQNFCTLFYYRKGVEICGFHLYYESGDVRSLVIMEF